METWPPISIICNSSIFLNTKAILVSWSKLWKKNVLIQINFNIVVYIVCRESVFTIPFFISESEIVSYNVWWFPFHLVFYQSVPLGLTLQLCCMFSCNYKTIILCSSHQFRKIYLKCYVITDLFCIHVLCLQSGFVSFWISYWLSSILLLTVWMCDVSGSRVP